MKEMFISKCLYVIKKNKILDNKYEVKLKYGLEVMYYFITKTLIILAISWIFDSLATVVIFNLFYIPLRSLAHGLHANNNIQCWIITAISYPLIIMFIKFIRFDLISIILLFIISFISFIIWAPADTKNLPLIHKKNRIKLKFLSLSVLLIEYFIILITGSNYAIISIITETININPIVYKLFKQKYNNYIGYQ